MEGNGGDGKERFHSLGRSTNRSYYRSSLLLSLSLFISLSF